MQTLFDSSREAEGRGEEGVEIGFKQTLDTYLPRGKTFTLLPKNTQGGGRIHEGVVVKRTITDHSFLFGH